MSKKRPVRALFDNLDELTPEEIASSEALKELLKFQVPYAILESHRANKQFAVIFEINSTSHFIEIHRKEWIQALETCIMWYLESEDYEECTKLQQVIAEIQNKKSTKLKIKTKENE
jgi:hypothetical protein